SCLRPAYVPPPALPPLPTRRSSDLDLDLDPRMMLAEILEECGHDERGERRVAPHGQPATDPDAILGGHRLQQGAVLQQRVHLGEDRKSTRLNSSHVKISYAVFCLKK